VLLNFLKVSRSFYDSIYFNLRANIAEMQLRIYTAQAKYGGLLHLIVLQYQHNTPVLLLRFALVISACWKLEAGRKHNKNARRKCSRAFY